MVIYKIVYRCVYTVLVFDQGLAIITHFLQENDDDIDEDDRYDDHDPRKPPPPTGGFDPLQFKGDPMALLKQSKKGKVVMLFVSVAGTPSRKDTEQITARWQTSLFNAQFQVER